MDTDVAGQSIAGLRQDMERLRHRGEKLREEVEAAEAGEVAQVNELARLQEELAAGGCMSADVAEVERALEEEQRVLRHAREALTRVEREQAEVQARIGAQEHQEEIERQREAAAPFLEEAADCLAGFARALGATTYGALQRRAELAAEVQRRFPLAPQVAPATLNELCARLVEQWKGPSSQTVKSGVPHAAVSAWLVNVLLGPVQTITAEQVLRGFHVNER